MQKPNEYKELFKYFKSKDLGINLNLGHLNLAAKAFKFSKHNFVELIKKYVVALELSDNNGLEDEHLPLKKKKWYWKINLNWRSKHMYENTRGARMLEN